MRLAGVSLDYYIRLERGNLRGASDSVLDALVRTLQLNDVKRDHLEEQPAPLRRTFCERKRNHVTA